jgi:hypothetical protein
MNFLALCSLWGALDRQGILPNKLNAFLRSADIDWALVGDAAAYGRGRLKGGDYSDGTLSAAVMDLVYAYDTETDSEATWSATPMGPIGVDTQWQIAGSQCRRFVLAFFKRVDPAVEDTRASNALRKYLSIRRAPRTQ